MEAGGDVGPFKDGGGIEEIGEGGGGREGGGCGCYGDKFEGIAAGEGGDWGGLGVHWLDSCVWGGNGRMMVSLLEWSMRR